MIIQDTNKAVSLLRSMRTQAKMLQRPIITLDTETRGEEVDGINYSALIMHRAHLVSFQICVHHQPRFAFMCDKLDMGKVIPELKELLEDAEIEVWMHNMAYDTYIMRNYGIRIANPQCTMLSGACFDENMKNSLKERAVLVGMLLKKTKTINFDDEQDLAEYGEDDITATERLVDFYNGGMGSKFVRFGGKSKLVKMKTPAKLHGIRREFYEKQELPFGRLWDCCWRNM